MPNSDTESVVDPTWTISPIRWRRAVLEQEHAGGVFPNLLGEIPVMSTTVLGLEMLLHEKIIDLQMVSELILRDVGATIQILRMVAQECDSVAERPQRMVDCIASLETGAWFGAVSAKTFVCDREHARITATWKHLRIVARYAQFVAKSIECISPEDAYLVGLLHGVGNIPTVLGWPQGEMGSKGQKALLEMEAILPPFVLAALQSLNDSRQPSPWKFILAAAHELGNSGIASDMRSVAPSLVGADGPERK